MFTSVTETCHLLLRFVCVGAGVLLCIAFGCYASSDRVENSNYSYYSNLSSTGVGGFRFRDFEPRAAHLHTPHVSGSTTEDTFAKEGRDDGNDGPSSSGSGRHGRGFHFHSDKEDMDLEMEFVVPFVKIPIERSMIVTKTTLRNLVNLNVSSLLWTGIIVAVGALVAGIFKAVSTPTIITTNDFGYGYGYKKNARGLESQSMDPSTLATSSHVDNRERSLDLVGIIEAKLEENDIDMPACIQRSICHYVQKSNAVVRSGRGSAVQRIIDGLANLETLHGYISGTAIQNAIDAGRRVGNCNRVYRNCKWSQQPTNKVMQFMMNYFKFLTTS